MHRQFSVFSHGQDGTSRRAHDAVRHTRVIRTHEVCRSGSLDSRLARVEMSASREPIEVNPHGRGAVRSRSISQA
jgi:hypothetical protein